MSEINSLHQLQEYAHENYVPIIRDESARFLQEQIALLKPERILEIGTAIGYSSTLMAKASPNSKITTIEINEDSYKMALETFKNNNISSKVEAILADARKVLQNFVEDNRKFDFIFLDGPKGQYINYLPLCKQLLEKGGVLFADNVFLHGWVKSTETIKHKHRAMVMNLRKYLEAITNDNQLETVIYEIEDGIAVSKKK